jgi:hypothetical protein
VSVVVRGEPITEQGPVFTAAPGEANDVTITYGLAGPGMKIATIH